MRRLASILTLIFLVVTHLSFGQPCGSCNQTVAAKTWVGDVDDDWNDPLNWSGDVLPTTESVTIDGGSYSTAPVISVNSTFSPADVFIVDGATLTVQANFSITDDFIIRNNSFLVIQSGSNASGDDINLCNGGTINMSDGALDNTSGSGLMRICTTEPMGATGNTEIIVSGGSITSTDSDVETGNVEDYVDVSGGGSYDDNNVSLPVDMVSFTGESDLRELKLSWVTASELNNSHFEVQQGINQSSFKAIGEVEGNGTTNEVNQYEFVVLNPGAGEYYRLKQYDFDGKIKIFGPLYVKSNSNFFSWSKSENQLLGVFSSQIPKQCLMHDLAGNVVVNTHGKQTMAINTSSLPNGVYIMNMIWNDQITYQKLLIE